MTDDAADLGAVVQQAIGQAIEDVVRTHEQGFVTKWLALVESVDVEGNRGMWALTSDDIKPWDVAGMLQWSLHLQAAQAFADAYDDDDDDDD